MKIAYVSPLKRVPMQLNSHFDRQIDQPLSPNLIIRIGYFRWQAAIVYL